MGENSVWSLLFPPKIEAVFGIVPFFHLLIVAMITLIVVKYRRRMYVAMVTLPRDLR
jgi:hypothetical protein